MMFRLHPRTDLFHDLSMNKRFPEQKASGGRNAMFKKVMAALAAIVAGVAVASAPVNASVPDWDKVVTATKPDGTSKSDHVFPPRGGTSKSAKTLPPSSGTIRTYTGGSQWVTNTGLFSGVKFRDNFRDTSATGSDYHNLIELAVEDTSGNAVEMGWGKGSWCPTSAACLFTFYWVNGGSTWGYNSGYSDYAGSSFNPTDTVAGTTETAGCTLPASKNERFGIRLNTTTNAWMLWADLCYGDSTLGQWIGEFPQSLWSGSGASFLSSDYVEIFNETATEYTVGSSSLDGFACSDQGGSLATSVSGTGMRIADINIQDVALGSVNFSPYVWSTGNYIDTEMVGKYGAAVLAGQPAGNARYINAGGLGFGPDGSGSLGDGNSVGGANCT